MMMWIVWGAIGLFTLFLVIGLIVQRAEGKDMETGGPAFVRFGGAVALCAVLEHMQRQDSAAEDRIDVERVFPTALLAGRKVLGEALTDEMLKEELKTVAIYGVAFLSKISAHSLYAPAQKKCSPEQKDKIVTAAYTALQLNYQDVGEKLLPLRDFAHQFYGDPVEADRRLTGAGGGVNLTQLSIGYANDILRDLKAGSQAPGAS